MLSQPATFTKLVTLIEEVLTSGLTRVKLVIICLFVAENSLAAIQTAEACYQLHMKRSGELKDGLNRLLDANILNFWCFDANKSYFGKLMDSLAVNIDSMLSTAPQVPLPTAQASSTTTNARVVPDNAPVLSNPNPTRCTNTNPEAPVYQKQTWYLLFLPPPPLVYCLILF